MSLSLLLPTLNMTIKQTSELGGATAQINGIKLCTVISLEGMQPYEGKLHVEVK
jgi:hypothetical protein